MNQKYEKLSVRVLLLILVEIAAMVLAWVFLFDYLFIVQFVFLFIDFVLLYTMVYTSKRLFRKRVTTVSEALGNDAESAFLFGEVGLVTYNEENTITWMSELFEKREINFIGEKLITWLPDLASFIKGEISDTEIDYQGHRYEITRFASDRILFFKDITKESKLAETNENQRIVLGIIHFDNYSETTEYEEEQRISYINSHIRQPVLDWAREYGMVLRRLRADRFFVILNESIYKKLINDHFQILSQVRRESHDYNVAITVSMSFARKNENLVELEEMVNNGLELAQSRGGDQVVVKTQGEDDRCIGGASEALEKRSQVRVRVMAQTIKDIVSHASQVLIVGHRMADFDCIGSAIGVSKIVKACGKQAYIIAEDKELEEKLLQAMYLYEDVLKKNNTFISIARGLEILNDKTLVILCDHHNLSQDMAPEIVKRAKRIMVIDHHRRHTDFEFKPMLSYIEPSASSTCELVLEFFKYQQSNIVLSDEESTLMYTGILIDTNNFRNRAGSRTFEVISQLRNMGADPQKADDLLKDGYEDFEVKTRLLSEAKMNHHKMMIAADDGAFVERSIMSQVADRILSIREVEAAFVIARVSEDAVAISARSQGKVNVQRIMEMMNGGGHFGAAATQIEGKQVAEVKDWLSEVIDRYTEEVFKENEINLVK